MLFDDTARRAAVPWVGVGKRKPAGYPAGTAVTHPRNLTEVLAQRGNATADHVISTLPWTLLADDDQRKVLRSTSEVLHVGGKFIFSAPSMDPDPKGIRGTLREHVATVRRG